MVGTVLAPAAAIQGHFADALQAVAAVYAGQAVIPAGQTVPGNSVVAEGAFVAVAAIGRAADNAANIAPFTEIRGVEEIAQFAFHAVGSVVAPHAIVNSPQTWSACAGDLVQVEVLVAFYAETGVLAD